MWGCNHEKKARDIYIQNMVGKHNDFKVGDSGLVVNPKWPHVGASPDGIVECKCCAKGVVEIKCPYCHRSDDVDAVAHDKNFCLKSSSDGPGAVYLDRTHAYYYQIQTQIFVCNVEYADFVVCTFPVNNEPTIHIERIYADQKFWSECITKSSNYFQVCILPELIGRWYTRPSTAAKCSKGTVASPSPLVRPNFPGPSARPDLSASPGPSRPDLLTAPGPSVRPDLSASPGPSRPDLPTAPGPSVRSDCLLSPISSADSHLTSPIPHETALRDARKYCYCQQPENGEMIACDHSICKFEWFHTRCLRIKTIPRGKWFCPTCRRLPECKKRKRKEHEN